MSSEHNIVNGFELFNLFGGMKFNLILSETFIKHNMDQW